MPSSAKSSAQCSLKRPLTAKADWQQIPCFHKNYNSQIAPLTKRIFAKLHYGSMTLIFNCQTFPKKKGSKNSFEGSLEVTSLRVSNFRQ